jgi:hypothetical protein
VLTRDERERLRAEIDRHARARLLASEVSPRRPEATERAIAFLLGELSRGPQHSTDIWRAAGIAGITEHAIKQARRVLNVQCSNGGRTGSVWRLR